MEVLTLKVASASSPSKLATSIVKSMEEGKSIETLSIGAGALNQAVKGIMIARGLASPHGKDLTIKPCFADILIDGQERTAVRLIILVNGIQG